jgi:hypothetical protein
MNGGVLKTGEVMGEFSKQLGIPLEFVPNPPYYQGDGFDIMRDEFLNKNVQIYPSDSRKKFGTIIDINKAGVTFKIYDSVCDAYTVDSVVFISFANNLTFRKV